MFVVVSLRLTLNCRQIDCYIVKRVRMGANKKCSRDDCPPVNIHKDYIAKCGNCGDNLHLPCIGIDHKVNEVLFHRNIRVFCNDCSALLSVGSNNAAVAKSIVKPSMVFGTTDSGASSAKIDEIAAILLEVRDTTRDINKKITSDGDSSHSYAAVVKKMDELKEIAAKTQAKVDEKCFEKSVVPLQANHNPFSFPPLGTPSSKRKCTSPPPSLSLPPPRKFLGCKLTSGTATVRNHGLGSRVELNSGNMMQSPRDRLNKAIYVSRMQNDVTKEKIVCYLKSQMAELNESDISLRLLVKKDVDVRTRRFISYRLACTEALYEEFIKPSFWPDHIEIGEFFEDSRDRGSNNVLVSSPLAVNAGRAGRMNRMNRPSVNTKESVQKSVNNMAVTERLPFTETNSAASKNEAPIVMETA